MVYTHNLADKHDTHVSVALATIDACRALPRPTRPRPPPRRRGLARPDWLTGDDKVALDVSARESLSAALIGVFDSQITGGKRYDLAVAGLRRAHATLDESHHLDASAALAFYMDLDAARDRHGAGSLAFAQERVERFATDVKDRIRRLRGRRTARGNHEDLDSPPGLLLLALAAAPALPAADLGPLAVVVETAVKVPMRDGVTLSADVYRPAAEEATPSSYAHALRSAGSEDGTGGSPRTATSSCCRTRAAASIPAASSIRSGTRRADGYDTVEWAAALPYADGKVGMFGGSYVGATQMLAAMAKPPHLVAIQPVRDRVRVLRGLDLPGRRPHGMVRHLLVERAGRGHAAPARRPPSRPRDWVEATPVESYRLARPARGGRPRPVPARLDGTTRPATRTGTRPRVSDHYGEMTVKALAPGGLARHLQPGLDRELHRDAREGGHAGSARGPAPAWSDPGRTGPPRPKARSATSSSARTPSSTATPCSWTGRPSR